MNYSLYKTTALAFLTAVLGLFVAAPSAQAQVSAARDLHLNAYYEATVKPMFYNYGEKTLDDFPRKKYCSYNGTWLRFGFGHLGNAIAYEKIKELDLFTPRSYKSRNCLFDSGYEFNGGDLRKSGSKILKQLEPSLKEYSVESKEALYLEKLVSDGSGILTTIEIFNPVLVKHSPTGRVRFNAVLSLSNCVDRYGQSVTSFDRGQMTSVSSALQVLRRSKFSDFARCVLTFKINRQENSIAIGRLDPTAFSAGYNNNISLYSFEIFQERPDALALTIGGKLQQTYTRQGPAPDPAAEDRATQAVNRFTSLVIDEYGDVLYSLSENDKLTSAERNQVIKAFFESHGHRLKTEMDAIDADFDKLNIMTKLSILNSIQQMYATISKIEGMVAISGSISLDKVVKRRL